MDEDTKLLKSPWHNHFVYSDDVPKFKLDDNLAAQDMDTFAISVTNNYEAIIARLEERLVDANDSLKIFKKEIETKTSALCKVSFHNILSLYVVICSYPTVTV